MRDGDLKLSTAEEISQFFKSMIACMLFSSGGHSLYEYTAPITQPDVRQEFQDIPDFDTINLESMFYSGNEASFEAALQDTIRYNNEILQRQTLGSQMTEHVVTKANQNPDPLKSADDTRHMKDTLHAAEGTLSEYRVALEHCKQHIAMTQERYHHRVEQLHFSSFRLGAKKQTLINAQLALVVRDINEEKLADARCKIQDLKSQLPEKNTFKKTTESYQLIDALEKSIASLEHLQRIAIRSKDTISRIQTTELYRRAVGDLKDESTAAIPRDQSELKCQ